MPTPKPPWYQFSLRSLLLVMLFVAGLCSVGVCIHWLSSAVIASIVVIGGVAGRLVAGTRLGFVQGVLFAVQYFLFTIVGCVFLSYMFPRVSPWGMVAILGVAILAGGMVGGYTVRPGSKS